MSFNKKASKIIFNGILYNSILEFVRNNCIYNKNNEKKAKRRMSNFLKKHFKKDDNIYNIDNSDFNEKIKLEMYISNGKRTTSPKCIKVMYKGNIYDSLNVLAFSIGLEKKHIKHIFMRNKQLKKNGIIVINKKIEKLLDKKIEQVKNGKTDCSITCSLNGNVFNSLNQIAKKLSLSKSYLTNFCRNKKIKINKKEIFNINNCKTLYDLLKEKDKNHILFTFKDEIKEFCEKNDLDFYKVSMFANNFKIKDL